MRVVRGIYHFPVKGLSPQAMRGVDLAAGKPFPFDRVFALTRPGVPVDKQAPYWAKKGLFLMLMLDETLACVQTHLDVDSMRFTVVARGQHEPDGSPYLLDADLRTEAGRAALEAFFQQQVPALKEAPTLLHMPDGHFMDKPDSVMSCINLATVRALEAEWGRPVNPLRFRANFYIDGFAPWAEFDWVGSDIQLGDVLFRVDRRNGRCGATNVNPVTGERDLDIPAALRKRYGHKDLGVYLIAQSSGKVVLGDAVTVTDLGAKSETPPATAPQAARGNFICRGCYYVYIPAHGAPGVAPGTPFSEISAGWRCADCGTGKSTFRPYLPELLESEHG